MANADANHLRRLQHLHLQQEASRKLGFTAKRTMGLAQGLYEGQDVGEGGTTGLITYMRTDSMNVSTIAQQEAREYVTGKYGSNYLPAESPIYKTKSANAQEAHEAIRPTSAMRDPEKVKDFLDPAMLQVVSFDLAKVCGFANGTGSI